MQENILVVDDNDDIRSNVAEYLRAKGWKAEEASTGPMAVAQVHTGAFDLVLLDLGLPGMDGIEVCRKLRSEGYSLPIMMLTARDELDDRVAGLQSGADDYLVKPFSLRELSARVEAILRRSQGKVVKDLKVGDLVLHLSTASAEREGKTLHLSPACFQILRVLMSKSPNIVPRDELEKALWGGDRPDSDSLRSNLWLLRNVVDKPFAAPMIKTHPGFGWSNCAGGNAWHQVRRQINFSCRGRSEEEEKPHETNRTLFPEAGASGETDAGDRCSRFCAHSGIHCRLLLRY